MRALRRRRAAGTCRCARRVDPALVERVSRRSCVDPKLLEILVCPVTKGPLVYDRERQELISQVGAARLSDPRRHSGDARGRGAQARRPRNASRRADRRRRRVFTVLIPARYASTRLPGKPLADIARQADGGARRRARAGERRARASWSPPTTSASSTRSHAHGIDAVHDARRPCDRHRPPRRGGAHARASPTTTIVVNVQGDEPLLEPALIRAVAELLAAHADAAIATACHPIDDAEEAFNPNVVKVVLDRARLRAVLQPRDDSLGARCVRRATRARSRPGCRSTATTGSTPTASRSCARYPDAARPRRSSASRRWSSCARCGTATASSSSVTARHARAGRRHAEDLERVRAIYASPEATV